MQRKRALPLVLSRRFPVSVLLMLACAAMGCDAPIEGHHDGDASRALDETAPRLFTVGNASSTLVSVAEGQGSVGTARTSPGNEDEDWIDAETAFDEDLDDDDEGARSVQESQASDDASRASGDHQRLDVGDVPGPPWRVAREEAPCAALQPTDAWQNEIAIAMSTPLCAGLATEAPPLVDVASLPLPPLPAEDVEAMSDQHEAFRPLRQGPYGAVGSVGAKGYAALSSGAVGLVARRLACGMTGPDLRCRGGSEAREGETPANALPDSDVD